MLLSEKAASLHKALQNSVNVCKGRNPLVLVRQMPLFPVPVRKQLASWLELTLPSGRPRWHWEIPLFLKIPTHHRSIGTRNRVCLFHNFPWRMRGMTFTGSQVGDHHVKNHFRARPEKIQGVWVHLFYGAKKTANSTVSVWSQVTLYSIKKA